MTSTVPWLSILVPAAAGVLVLPARRKMVVGWAIAMLAALGNVALAVIMFRAAHADLKFSWPWAGFGLDLALRVYPFSAWILLAASALSACVILYCGRFLQTHPRANLFLGFAMLSLAMVNGALLADHLVTMLFFWEGLLGAILGLIAVGKPGAWKTAIKAFVIVGVSDLCLMGGIAVTGMLAGTLQMSAISALHLSASSGLGALALVLLLIGATAKAGSMPFHTWIPDAADAAPLPFMALFPASLEKLLGIYMLSRVALDLYHLDPASWASTALMTVGAITILLAVAMALVQKDYKRLLSYHAISQVGYMILGVGTAVPAGIVGGLFHMINNALYKNALFLSAGAVEKQTGTTNLKELGGLARKMPITFACFLVAAASISGVPPFNGFFSKELVYDGALERGTIFYVAALLGSLLTAASFLKLGHAAYLGPRRKELEGVREAAPSMLLPMVLIAAACVWFGVGNALPIDHIQHVMAPSMPAAEHAAKATHHLSGWPESQTLVLLTAAVLVAAILNHVIGARRAGSGLGAVDHIHHAPVLSTIYDNAQKGRFDPYNWARYVVLAVAGIGWLVDRTIDKIYEGVVVGLTLASSALVRAANTGSYALYILLCLAGAAGVIAYLMIGVK